MNETVPNCLPHSTAFTQQHMKPPPVLWRTGNCFPSSFCWFSIGLLEKSSARVPAFKHITLWVVMCSAFWDKWGQCLLIPRILWVPLQITLFVIPHTASFPRGLWKQEKGKRPLWKVGISMVPHIKSGREASHPVMSVWIVLATEGTEVKRSLEPSSSRVA